MTSNPKKPTRRKQQIIKRRQELEKKLRHRIDDLSSKEQDDLQAIAIQYDRKSKQSPTVVASGRGKIAQKILALAEENKIPMIEDSNLSKLLSSIKVKAEIPSRLFKVIAEVIAFVFYLEQKKTRAKAPVNIKKPTK